MVDGPASILRRPMLTDMLNTPVAELAVSDNINACKNLIDARALIRNCQLESQLL